MAKDTIRVGFIGAGGNTRSRHIPGLKAQAGIELAAVANRSVASGTQDRPRVRDRESLRGLAGSSGRRQHRCDLASVLGLICMRH